MTNQCLRLIEYRTEDGTVFHLDVPSAIAEILKDEGSHLKETTFTDLAGRSPRPIKDDRTGINPDAIDELTGHRRVSQRPMPTGNPWEGPRFTFSLRLGEHRPGWNGGPCIDERGRCGICHDQPLPPYACCLACNTTGRDREIPTAGERERPRAYRQSGRLKGGMTGKR